MQQADAERMRRWQQGDATAFEELVRHWQGPVGRFLYRLGVPCDQVADLCQDVFLRVYRKGADYREAGTFSTWLYQIALNAARDAARRARRLPMRLESHDPQTGASGGAELCEEREVSGLVQEALTKLPEPLREVVVLRHYEDMNFEEMARLLKTPASTLKSRFSAALGQLRTRLKHLGWSPEETTR